MYFTVYQLLIVIRTNDKKHDDDENECIEHESEDEAANESQNNGNAFCIGWKKICIPIVTGVALIFGYSIY